MTVTCPLNGTVTLRFETDAEDKYFNPYVGLGKAEFSHDIVQRSQLKIGIFTITLKPSSGIPNLQEGQKINFNLKILEKNKEKFSFDVPIEITKSILPPTGPGPGPRPPRGPAKPYTRIKQIDPNSNNEQGSIDIPNFYGINKEKNPTKWKSFFGTNDRRGAHVDIDSEGKVKTIWVNTSHPSLIHYKNNHHEISEKKLINKYVNFVGMKTYSLFFIEKGKIIDYGKDFDPKKMMEIVSDAVAFFGMTYDDAAR